jgi:hypothetical protein
MVGRWTGGSAAATRRELNYYLSLPECFEIRVAHAQGLESLVRAHKGFRAWYAPGCAQSISGPWIFSTVNPDSGSWILSTSSAL